MRHLMLAVFMLASGHAAGEWLRLGESGELTFYVDPVTVVRTDSTTKVLALHDHKASRTNVRGWIYRSEKIQSEFDCQRERWRPARSTLHLGQMGRGPVVGDERSGEWIPVASDSVGRAVWDFACGKR